MWHGDIHDVRQLGPTGRFFKFAELFVTLGIMPSELTPQSGTVRAQARKDKAVISTGVAAGQDRSRMDKEVVKAVLASPLTIPWCVKEGSTCLLLLFF